MRHHYWLRRTRESVPEGPYPREVLFAMRNRGEVVPTSLMREDGTKEWAEAIYFLYEVPDDDIEDVHDYLVNGPKARRLSDP